VGHPRIKLARTCGQKNSQKKFGFFGQSTRGLVPSSGVKEVRTTLVVIVFMTYFMTKRKRKMYDGPTPVIHV
jgi:hypothetical protein